ncbi:MAG: hypothetical protein JNL26_18040 [Gemmatimonadetes bacterium]|nr:hypothetical protein [Gemmatimonadota bacterium]
MNDWSNVVDLGVVRADGPADESAVPRPLGAVPRRANVRLVRSELADMPPADVVEVRDPTPGR